MLPGESQGLRRPTLSDWNLCQDIARRHGRSFYLASRLLPSRRQRGVIATYAWCRLADDIVDHAGERGPEATARALDAWERQLAHPTHPVAIAFAATREWYGVPLEPAHDLVDGLRMDLGTARYATWDDLRTYCYHVAGTVGLLVAPILGCDDPAAHPHAAELGIAMQLTNILRDVAEDARMDRLYLPADEIAAFGCDPETILACMPAPAFRDLMVFQIDRARALYASALQGVSALAPSGRFATISAANLYAGILAEIEALDYDVFRARATVPTARKLRTVAVASASASWMSVPIRGRVARAEAPDARYSTGDGGAPYRTMR